ncbi:hypothetical protein KHP62_15065 [Rhodobacteraceae bacterium NNCM2]|nr:hypothetical protein [Coraliihabitans acroporae]
MSIIFGNGSDNNLVGTSRNDLLLGFWGDDEMDGGDGNDLMFGGSGDDSMQGGAGNDLLFGGRGDDTVQGGVDNDVVYGGSGDDVLYGDNADDGGSVDTDFNYVTNGSFEDVTGMRETNFGYVGEIPGWTNSQPGNAEVVASGIVDMPASEGDYWVDTGTMNNNVIDISQQIDGLEDGDTYRLSFDAGQWDTPSPAPDETMNVYWNGELVANIRPETVGGYEQFEFDIVAGSGDGTNTLRFEGVPGTDFDNQGVVIDNIAINAIEKGEGGDDAIIGGSGNDQMFGGFGDDILKGGNGNDINTGGDGADCFLFDTRDGTDTVTDFEIGTDKFVLFGRCVSFDDLGFSQNGDDAEVEFGNTTIVVEDTTASDLTEDDFIFV